MRIHLNFIALKSDHLPEEGTDVLDLKDGATVTDVVTALGLGDDMPYMTLKNDTSVPKSERKTTMLEEGDALTLFSPIKGG